MRQSPCSQNVGLKKGPWTPEEDQKLLSFIQQHGDGNWRALPAKAGLKRCGKSCRLRWINYLRPDIKRGKFSLQEEQTIIQLHALLGNRWSAIAAHLPKRTDNEIKNYWNTQLKKRLSKMGIDPVTHKPKTDSLSSTNGNPKDAANLSHMAQWERARLEAEARLVRESNSKRVSNQLGSSSSSSSSARRPPVLVNNNNNNKPPCLDVLKAWQRVVTGMFSFNTDNNNLESPTSTLPISSVGFNNDYDGFVEKSSQIVYSYMEDNNAIQLNLEGYSDTLMACDSVDHHQQSSLMDQARENFNVGTSYDGDNFEENKNYWNSILNSPSDSPVF